MRRITIALAVVLTTIGALLGISSPAHAATYMGTGWYWNPNDSKLYCNVGIITQSDGSKICTGGSTAGYILVKYPGSSSYCYRRNLSYIKRYPSGALAWTYSGSLYYIC